MSLDTPELERLAALIAARVFDCLHAEHHRLLDRRGLADRLGVSERGVTGLVSRGELPAGYLIGGVRRWQWEEVLRYLAARAKRRPRRGRGIYDRGSRGQG